VKKATKIEVESSIAQQLVAKEARSVRVLTKGLDSVHGKEEKLGAILKVLEAQSIMNKKITDKLVQRQRNAQEVARTIDRNSKALSTSSYKIRHISYTLKDKANLMDTNQKEVETISQKLEKDLGITSDVSLGTHHAQMGMEDLHDQMDRTLLATTALSSGLEKQEQKLLRKEQMIDQHGKEMKKQAAKAEENEKKLDKSAKTLDKIVKTNAEQDVAIAQNVATLKQHDDHMTELAKEQFETSTMLAKREMKHVQEAQKNLVSAQTKASADETELQDHLDKSEEGYKRASALNSGLVKGESTIVMKAHATGNKSVAVEEKGEVVSKELKRMKEKEKADLSKEMLGLSVGLLLVVLIGGYFVKQIQDTEKDVQAIKEAMESWDAAQETQDDNAGQWDDPGMYPGQ